MYCEHQYLSVVACCCTTVIFVLRITPPVLMAVVELKDGDVPGAYLSDPLESHNVHAL